jgi:carboxypeptidase Q
MSRLLTAVLAAASLPAQSLTELYRDPASRLIGAALTDNEGWEKLAYLCDRIGHRLAGSPAMAESIRWAAETMRRDGLENVQTPKVMVPHWMRGAESLELLEPGPHRVAMLGLGNSVGTPADGITAEVLVVETFEEMEKLGADQVRGRIVLYNAPWQGYGRTVQYRSSGASRAARLGAVAALVRSVGPVSLRTPHTGMLSYVEGPPRIPAAAVSIEDAERIARLAARGVKVRVRLKMEARMLPEAEGANVIGEYRGREKPEEIVALGGHYDSWDVGHGAHDDGAGCVAAWQAVVLMKKLGLRPRRTVRVVLWANEENGLAGANAYRQWAGDAVKNHVAAIEMDGGAERPVGFGLGMGNVSEEVWARALRRAQEIGALLEGIGAAEIRRGGGGADIGPLMRAGVPGLGHLTVGTHYFDWHHTEADTLDKVDPQEFRKNVAALAVMAYVLADMPGRLGE